MEAIIGITIDSAVIVVTKTALHSIHFMGSLMWFSNSLRVLRGAAIRVAYSSARS